MSSEVARNNRCPLLSASLIGKYKSVHVITIVSYVKQVLTFIILHKTILLGVGMRTRNVVGKTYKHGGSLHMSGIE